MFLILLLISFVAIPVSIYVFLIWNFDYWKKLGVNGPKPKPFVGTYPSLLTQSRHTSCDLQDIYETFKKTDDFVGIFGCRTPQLLILNPELVHRILVNDFKHFHDNEISSMVDEKSDFILANNPVSLTGEYWKERRAELTPGLTVNRVKSVFPITNTVCQRMMKYIEQQIKIADKDGVDGRELSIRFTSEVVTDCVLGIKAESFTEKPSPIMKMISNLFDQNGWFIALTLLLALFPSLSKVCKLRFVSKETEKFFVNLMGNAIDMRKAENNKDRVDFFNYIIQLQEKKQLTNRDVTAHTMTFLFDGFETTAIVLSHALLFLGRDLERQQKLRNEILETLGTANNFETLMDLPYLDAVLHETLRIFPPCFFANKICTEPIDFVNKNGRTLHLPRGTVVGLPWHAIMSDKEYYSDAFEPERFLEENGGHKKYKDMGVYYGFGDGPRVCLGIRFAMAQLKAAIVEILRTYEVRVNSKTRSDNCMDPKYTLTRLDGGIWLDFKKLE